MSSKIRLSLGALVALLSLPALGATTCLDTLFHDRFGDPSQISHEVELVISQLGSRSASFQLNGGETLMANGDGSYCFTEQIQGGQPYEVTVVEQPASGNQCGGNLTAMATGPVSIDVSCGLGQTEWDQFNWGEANWN